MNIEQNLKQFAAGLGKNRGRQAAERYASFDYCFNYFQTFREEDRIEKLADPSHIELSSLQLGFYLASWGMLRGSSFLLEKSVRFYQPLIHGIATFDKRVWSIDADSYDDQNIAVLLACRKMIVESLGRERRPSDTLVTKIMLGVFGNVPAFDDFFRKGFVTHSFGKNSLLLINEFYKQNKRLIDNTTIYTFDYLTAGTTKRRYTKAKIIDMIGFIEGINKRLLLQKKLASQNRIQSALLR
jgi:hypothetical protein